MADNDRPAAGSTSRSNGLLTRLSNYVDAIEEVLLHTDVLRHYPSCVTKLREAGASLKSECANNSNSLGAKAP